jgi:hypothetical protein
MINGSRKLSMVQNGYSEDFESSRTSGAPEEVVNGGLPIIFINLTYSFQNSTNGNL